jgi:hypothetical protein
MKKMHRALKIFGTLSKVPTFMLLVPERKSKRIAAKTSFLINNH